MTTKKSFERNLKNDLNFSRQPTLRNGLVMTVIYDFFDMIMIHTLTFCIFDLRGFLSLEIFFKVHEPHISNLLKFYAIDWNLNLFALK